MSTFIIKARNNIDRANGFHIDKGQEFIISINMSGITPINLFGNSRCKAQLIQQLRFNGINLPDTDPVMLSKGYWDIKMK
jgi:hypothetical protein